MTTDDYSSLSTNRLIELFKSAAKRMGAASRFADDLRQIRDPDGKIAPVDFEALRPVTEQLRGLSHELRARPDTSWVEPLLEDGDPNVCRSAAIAFGYLAPELADAAIEAAIHMRPTREVLALQRCARQPPPRRPTLEEMTDDQLVARFEDAATRESGSHFLDFLDNEADQDLQNEIVREVWDIMLQLKARGLLDRLLPLLASDDLTVRREAATACLRVAEPQASAALATVVRHGFYPDNVLAREALDNWRDKGRAIYGL